VGAGVSAGQPPERERDPAELVIFAALALLSVWMLGLLVKRAVGGDEIWTGTDGLHVSDQLQYLNWIRDAAQHVLISDLYQLRPTAASFLHPGFLLSGALTALGVVPWLAYLLWKPAAVVSLFLAVRAYVHRTVSPRPGRRAALILALFFVPTAAFISSIAGATANLYLLGIEVELWPGTWLWGYSFTVLAVAAIPAALLLYEHDRRRRRIGALGPLIALLCSWFQPWQGATLLGTLVATELLMLASDVARRRGGRAGLGALGRLQSDERPLLLPLLAVNVVAGAGPLVYYALLARFDPSWAVANRANTFGAWPLWTLVVSILPLALPAVFACFLPPATFQDVAVRTWPLVGLTVYWLIAYAHIGTFPIHALQGLTIPVAILAVIGAGVCVRTWGRVTRVAAVCVIAALTVPALVWKLNDARNSITQNAAIFPGAPPNTYFLPRNEADALRFVDHDPRRGGVLTRLYLGQLIPAETGRRTWVGALSWTPDFLSRVTQVDRLFDGVMTSADAIAFVRSTGATYLIVDCQHHPDLATLLRPIIDDARRFGCATVLHVAAA
jgi:hypothetical protein